MASEPPHEGDGGGDEKQDDRDALTVHGSPRAGARWSYDRLEQASVAFLLLLSVAANRRQGASTRLSIRRVLPKNTAMASTPLRSRRSSGTSSAASRSST